MSDAKADRKDKKIRIFKEINSEDGTSKKEYVVKGKLWAQIRNATLSERHSLNAEQEVEILDVIVNFREIIKQDMFVEYHSKTYQIITPPDNFDKIESRFKMKLINEKEYEEIIDVN